MKVFVKIYQPDNWDEPIQITGVSKTRHNDDDEEFELEE